MVVPRQIPVPTTPDDAYDEEIGTCQIVRTDLSYGDGRTRAPRLYQTVLFSSSSVRMTWLMLRSMKEHDQLDNIEIRLMWGSIIPWTTTPFRFMWMVQNSYIYNDFGTDSPFIEWIEVYELQGITPVMTYTGTWFEVYKELCRWDPERSKRAWAKVMRQNRPFSKVDKPYLDFAYGSCANLMFDYKAWWNFQLPFGDEHEWMAPGTDWSQLLESISRGWNRWQVATPTA
ncbi:MAG: hypothetical protein U0X20_16910 [Caldilineaceae bacterium]